MDDAASIAHAVVAASSANEFDASEHRRTGRDRHRRRRRGDGVPCYIAHPRGQQFHLHGEVLDALPAADVVISVTASGNTDVTVSPATLTFTPANWSTAKTVTVSAAQDTDAVNDAASITHAVVAASSADEFDAATIAGVTVTVADDDARLVLDVEGLEMNEGSSSTAYDVKLGGQPTGNVVVRVTVSGSSDVAVDTNGRTGGDQDTLTFTNGNWDTGQLVRVRAAEDADAVNDAASITHSGGGRRQRRRVRRRARRRAARDRHRQRRRGDGVLVHADGGRGRQRHLHGGPGRSARLRRGDHGEQR